jgi:hypothetical protein
MFVIASGISRIFLILCSFLLFSCVIAIGDTFANEIQLSCQTTHSYSNVRISNNERGVSGTSKKIIEITIMNNQATTLWRYANAGPNSRVETVRYFVQISSNSYTFFPRSENVSSGFTFYVNRSTGYFFRQDDFISREWVHSSKESGDCVRMKMNPRL